MNITEIAKDLRHAEPLHLEDVEIPILAGPQVQGDVFIVPVRPGGDKGELIGAEGVAVVRGENGGNTHALFVGDGQAYWRPNTSRGLTLGVLSVEGTVFLHHPEHGYNGIGTGTYNLKRQREQAEEIRLVAD